MLSSLCDFSFLVIYPSQCPPILFLLHLSVFDSHFSSFSFVPCSPSTVMVQFPLFCLSGGLWRGDYAVISHGFLFLLSFSISFSFPVMFCSIIRSTNKHFCSSPSWVAFFIFDSISFSVHLISFITIIDCFSFFPSVLCTVHLKLLSTIVPARGLIYCVWLPLPWPQHSRNQCHLSVVFAQCFFLGLFFQRFFLSFLDIRLLLLLHRFTSSVYCIFFPYFNSLTHSCLLPIY